MKHTNKLRLTLLVLCVISIACMLLLTSCDEKATEAYITNSDLPRTTYVQGQELDLSTGILTVVLDGEESKVPLNAPEVTVTGYDKDTLGEQTLTVTHGELTASFTVTVVPRITAEGFESSYFMGDAFNKNVGKLKVAGDDAKIFAVNMSDNRVSLVSFDSSAAGTATVTVRYSDGKVSYDCQFDVTVYDTSNMQFTPPKNTKYSSHAKELNVTGSYFTVQTADKKLEKKVPLTAEMVTGFNPGAATMANRTTPLTQKLTVNYLGQTFEFDITITFSGVSVVEYYANGPLAALDPAGTLTAEQKQDVLDALEEFCALSKANRALLSKGTVDKVVALGAVVASELFQQELKGCEDTFAMTVEPDENGKKVGNLSLVGASYASAVADLAKIQDDDSDLNLYKGMLAMLGEEYPNVTIKVGQKVADLAVVYSDEMQTMLVEVLEHLIKAYKTMEVVPENWTVETLAQYGDAIERAVLEIGMTDYYQATGGGIYIDVLSPWRVKNDYFEIVYSYALYVYEGDANFMETYLFGKMPMPGLLEEWYWCLNATMMTQSLLGQAYGDSRYDGMDLWEYMYEYLSLMDIARRIEASGDKLLVDTFNRYGLKTLHKQYLSPYSLGYPHAQAMIDSERFHALWDVYFRLLVQIKEPKDPNQITLSTVDLLEMYRAFELLSPAELRGFLSSISFKYANLRGNKLILYYDANTAGNVFTGMLRDGYAAHYLNNATRPLFAKLLQAMEHYALLGYERDALEEFQQLMKEIIDAYSLLSDTNRKNFDDYAGVGFERYRDIYLKTKGESTLTISAEERALLDALQVELRRYMEASEWAATNAVSGEFNAMMDAIYAKATSIYKTLLSSKNADVLIALFTEQVVFANDETDPDDDDSYTLEQLYYEIDSENAYYLLGSINQVLDDGKIVHLTHWDAFEKYGLFELYAKMADLLYYAYMDRGVALDAAALASLASEIAGLSDMQRYYFIGMYADSAYHWAKSVYLQNIMIDGTDAEAVAEQLEGVGKKYMEYRYNGDAKAKDAFLQAMAAAKTAYTALSDADQATLAEVYNYYQSIYEALTAPANS